MSKLAHSNQETMDQIERDALNEPTVNDDPPSVCEKCGAVE